MCWLIFGASLFFQICKLLYVVAYSNIKILNVSDLIHLLDIEGFCWHTCVTAGISWLCSICLDIDMQYWIVRPFSAAPWPICVNQSLPNVRLVCNELIYIVCLFNQSCNGNQSIKKNSLPPFCNYDVNIKIYHFYGQSSYPKTSLMEDQKRISCHEY